MSDMEGVFFFVKFTEDYNTLIIAPSKKHKRFCSPLFPEKGCCPSNQDQEVG